MHAAPVPQVYKVTGVQQLEAAATRQQVQELLAAPVEQLAGLLAGQDVLLLYLRASAVCGRERMYAKAGDKLSALVKHLTGGGSEQVVGAAGTAGDGAEAMEVDGGSRGVSEDGGAAADAAAGAADAGAADAAAVAADAGAAGGGEGEGEGRRSKRRKVSSDGGAKEEGQGQGRQLVAKPALLARYELLHQLWLWLVHREWEVARWVRGRSSKVCCKEGGLVREQRAELERMMDGWSRGAAEQVLAAAAAGGM